MHFFTLFLALFCGLFTKACIAVNVLGGTVDGKIELQHRHFFDQSSQTMIQGSGDESNSAINGQTSASINLEYFTEWNNANDRLEVELFGRVDGADDERSHADVRQFLWTHYGDNYEFSAGIGRVFWGVTETQHLVDIINQTDFVENIDGEDKLGQPMLRYQRFGDWGTLEAYLLPYFRERTFEGQDGRLSGPFVVDTNNPIYQSSAEDTHVDWALRYANTFGLVDLGLSYFDGTAREPNLFLGFNPATQTTQPFYPQLQQFAADVQLTAGSWLLKLEAVQRNFDLNSDLPQLEDYAAATAGFEYTLVGIMGSKYDLGLLAEYSWDERGEMADSLFQNDLSVGARLALNDIADSQFLLAVSEDLDYSGSQAVFLEGSTRINNALSVTIEARYFDAQTPNDPVFFFRDSSFVQLGLEYYFD